MVPSARPLPRASSGRFTHHRGGDATAAASTPDKTTTAQHGTKRRRALEDELLSTYEINRAKAAKKAAATPASGPASASHKRAGSAKPPTKLPVTQPELNGIQPATSSKQRTPTRANTPNTQRGQDGAAGGKGLSGPDTQDKRTLRSQDGTSRLNSELATYFPNYDDVINDVPASPEFLGLDTPIHIIDEPLKPSKSAAKTPPDPPQTNGKRLSITNGVTPTTSPQKPISPSTSLNGCQRIDFSAIHRHASTTSTSEDPLPDSLFFKPHRRAERKEKQLRNIEKERAMHEKVQLERLLDGLLGPDWLRVMGITGVTESERKEWEPKRDYFVTEVRALVDKFRQWKEDEKRLKAEKEERLAREEEEADEEEEAIEDEVGTEAPNSSDVDGEAASQLLREAGLPTQKQRPRPKPKPKPVEVFKPPEPEKPFTSFFSKPHLRAAALGKARHGRGVLAFGLPVPEFQEHEFTPGYYVTEDVVRANARKRRRLRRATKD